MFIPESLFSYKLQNNPCIPSQQRYYLSTAKEFMRINGTSKSLVASHIAESIAGSATIRAFEEQDRFFEKNLDLIDKNASPFFHSFAANEWLIQRIEILAATVLASSALFMVLLPHKLLSSGLYFNLVLSPSEGLPGSNLKFIFTYTHIELFPSNRLLQEFEPAANGV